MCKYCLINVRCSYKKDNSVFYWAFKCLFFLLLYSENFNTVGKIKILQLHCIIVFYTSRQWIQGISEPKCQSHPQIHSGQSSPLAFSEKEIRKKPLCPFLPHQN